MKSKPPYCNAGFFFHTKCKTSEIFTFKCRIQSILRPVIVYKFEGDGCNATYYSKTKRHFKVRICGYLITLALTGRIL